MPTQKLSINNYSRTGSLFEKRFRRKIVSSAKYFCFLVHYIHFNPQKHGFVKDYREYHYSSYSIVLSHKQTKLDRTAVLGYFGGKEAYLEYHNAIPDEKMIYDFIQEDIETPGKQ